MIDDEVIKFTERVGFADQKFGADNPLCFCIQDKYHFCLEYRHDEVTDDNDFLAPSLPLILSMRVEIPSYDQESLMKLAKSSSFFDISHVPFMVGFRNNSVYLMTDIALNATAADIENAVILLKKQYDEVIHD